MRVLLIRLPDAKTASFDSYLKIPVLGSSRVIRLITHNRFIQFKFAEVSRLPKSGALCIFGIA